MPMKRITAPVLLPTGIARRGPAWPRHRAWRVLAVLVGILSYAAPTGLLRAFIGLGAREAFQGSPPHRRNRGPAPLGQGYGHPRVVDVLEGTFAQQRAFIE